MNDLRTIQAEIGPALEELDEKRQAIVFTVWGAIIADIVLILILLSVAGVFPAILAGAVVAIICIFVFRSRFQVIRLEYKQMVMDRLIKLFGPGFSYYPILGISQSEFEASKLFTTRPNRYSTEDLIEGRLGKTDLKFAEVNAQHVTSNGKTTTVRTVFRGVFFVADFHKHFKSETRVLPDIAESAFGSLIGNALQRLNFSRPGKLIKLENIEFEQLFAVFGHDEVEARYILTPAMMERMVALKRRFGREVSFAFSGNRVIIAIEVRENLFEPPGRGTFSDSHGFEQVRRHLDWLKQLFGIVEELDLNTRIWTKE